MGTAGLIRSWLNTRGWRGVLVSLAAAAVGLLAVNFAAYGYLEARPPAGPDAYKTLPGWRGLQALTGPVDTLILGDSSARVNFLTGPVSDRLGGAALNLGNSSGSTLLMDAWMAEEYIQRWGPPRRVILSRITGSYYQPHLLEFMAAVPLEWGYWDRLGPTPAWEGGDLPKLFLKKYGVLYSQFDILAARLAQPQEWFRPPAAPAVPGRAYANGLPADPANLDRIMAEKPAWLFAAFIPLEDNRRGLDRLAALARQYRFPLYIVATPEYEVAYPARRQVLADYQAFIDTRTDGRYVFRLLSQPPVYPGVQMQDPNHLDPPRAEAYTGLVLDAIQALPAAP
jgi:hypothetical protein